MRIALSNGTFVTYDLGSHYAHIVTPNDKELDVFSFAWEKDKTTQQDFLDALEIWTRDE